MADTTGLWTSEYFYREAAKIGPATRTVIEELISAKAIPAQAFQSCRNGARPPESRHHGVVKLWGLL